MRSWTEAEIDIIVKQIKLGGSKIDIATRVRGLLPDRVSHSSVTKCAVYQKITLMMRGIFTKGEIWTEEEIEIMNREIGRGGNRKEISERVGRLLPNRVRAGGSIFEDAIYQQVCLILRRNYARNS